MMTKVDGRRRSSFKIVLYIGPLSPESLPEAFFVGYEKLR